MYGVTELMLARRAAIIPFFHEARTPAIACDVLPTGDAANVRIRSMNIWDWLRAL